MLKVRHLYQLLYLTQVRRPSNK